MLKRSSYIVIAAISLNISLAAPGFASDSTALPEITKTALAVPVPTANIPLGTVKDDPVTTVPNRQPANPESPAKRETRGGPATIDNDERSTTAKPEYQWNEVTDSQGRTQIEAGAKFPVSMVSALTSKTAKVGDPVEGRTSDDIRIAGRLVAPKGSEVIGHVATTRAARKLIHAEFSFNRWLRPSGALGLQFDEIITPNGDHLPLVAAPARQARIVIDKAEGRVLGINKKGEITTPCSGQLKAQMIQIAIRAGASAGGVFSMGAAPLAFGLIGAASPSFAFMHPVGTNVKHRRLKGFGIGVISGLPGGFLISDSIISGQEAIIVPGDEFLAEFKERFSGEPAMEAQLIPGAKLKVHGEILPN